MPLKRFWYRKTKGWIRVKLRKWLGVEENEKDLILISKLYDDMVSIGVDVHFHSQSMILIYTAVGGGHIRHINTNFKSIKHYLATVEELTEKYRTRAVWTDTPPGFNLS